MKIFNYRRNKKVIDWSMAILFTCVSAIILSYVHYSNLYMMIISDKNDNWYVINPQKDIGNNLYTKLVRRFSLMGHESNVITLNTFVDSKGKRLRKECVYKLSILKDDYIWAEAAAYDDNKKIIISRESRLSVDSIHEGLKKFEVILGGTEISDNWIPLGGIGAYQVQIRLYVESKKYLERFNVKDSVANIERISCRGGKS